MNGICCHITDGWEDHQCQNNPCRNFYQMPYQAEEEAQFYPEFEERLERLNAMFGF